jgi:hypothetical protein
MVGANRHVRAIRNLYALALPLPMSVHAAISAASAAYYLESAKQEPAKLLPHNLALKYGRLVVGYISTDLFTK